MLSLLTMTTLEQEKVHKVYSAIADHFSNTRFNQWQWITDFINETAKPGNLVLDIGCGNGRNMEGYDKNHVYGIDTCPEFVEICNERGFQVLQANMCHIPFPDNYFDHLLCIASFHHLSTEERRLEALREMHRVLKPHGRLVMSDPTCEQPMNDELRNDDRLRALCLSGSLSIADYVKALTDAGFGTIEIRARKPYRILDPKNYPTDELIYIESIEVAAIKDPMPEDGPCIFTGKAAIYYGDDDYFDDGLGHTLLKNQPLAICDKTAKALQDLGRDDIFFSPSTFHYDGGGCC